MNAAELVPFRAPLPVPTDRPEPDHGRGIVCPACGSMDSKVIDSRQTNENSIRRRRACVRCGHRQTTYEIVYEDLTDGRDRRQFEARRAAVVAVLRQAITLLDAGSGPAPVAAPLPEPEPEPEPAPPALSDDWISVSDAAYLAKRSNQWIKIHIRDQQEGSLWDGAYHSGTGRWLVSRSGLLTLIDRKAIGGADP